MKDQQQLAEILDLTCWHLMQTNSVSLQLSLQRGIRQRPYVPTVKKRQMHHAIATPPIFFLGMLSVECWQVAQGDPLLLLLLFPRLMIMGPWG